MQHLDLIRHNFIAKATHFARLIPGMSVEENPALVRVDSGLPSDTYNAAVLKTADFDATRAVVQYYQNKNFPAAFWIFESPDTRETEQQLLDLQLLCNEVNVGMWADLHALPLAPTDSEDFKIEMVTTAEALSAYAEVLVSLFEPSDEAIQIRDYHQLILPYYQNDPRKMQFYIGLHAGNVVTTGTLFFDQDTAGIYDIATREEARGKGLGSKMFQFLLQKAKKQGAWRVALQASADGLGIYKKAGFQEVGTVKVWENRHLLA